MLQNELFPQKNILKFITKCNHAGKLIKFNYTTAAQRAFFHLSELHQIFICDEIALIFFIFTIV